MKFLMLGASCLVLTANTVQAQGVYGSTSLGLFSTDVTDNTSSEGTSFGIDFNGYIGVGVGSGFYVEGETRLQFAANNPGTNDSLKSGGTFAMRVGRDFGAFNGEVFGGYVSAITDEGSTNRTFLGLAGGYEVSQRLAFSGLVGYLDGTGGSDDSGLDGFREMAHIGVGVNYAASSNLTIDGNIAYGSGIMDDDAASGSPPDDDGEVFEISLGISYVMPQQPNMEIFGRVTYIDMEQPDESDDATDTQIAVGFNWNFGASPARDRAARARLPRYSDWLATSAGVLE